MTDTPPAIIQAAPTKTEVLMRKLFPKPNGTLTDAIACVESSFGKRQRSYNGACQGWHMMSGPAWTDVSTDRIKRKMPTYHWSKAFDYTVSSAYCGDYLILLRQRLQAALNRKPTTREILSAYRMGFAAFKTTGFSPSAAGAYCDSVERHLK